MGIFISVNNVRFTAAIWLLLALLPLIMPHPASAQVPARGEAYISVTTDVTTPDTPDTVTLRIVDNTDKMLLLDLALKLGQALHSPPGEMTYRDGNPMYIQDKGIGLECLMVVVPRKEHYLPIAPFVETLASRVAKVHLLYIVKGSYTYQGIQQYNREGIQVTVDPPETGWADARTPVALYGMNIAITTPTPGPVEIPHYADPMQEARGGWWRIIGWIMLAGLVGAGVGLLGAKLLARLKAAAGLDDGIPTGGKR